MTLGFGLWLLLLFAAVMVALASALPGRPYGGHRPIVPPNHKQGKPPHAGSGGKK